MTSYCGKTTNRGKKLFKNVKAHSSVRNFQENFPLSFLVTFFFIVSSVHTRGGPEPNKRRRDWGDSVHW